MSVPAEKHDSRLMRAMFASIAPRYDFITRILSYGMDRRWKRLGVMQAVFPENATVLDLASGTGDFSKLVRERQPDSRPIAVDITEPMLQLARAQGLRDAVCGDATSLRTGRRALTTVTSMPVPNRSAAPRPIASTERR